MRRLTAVATAVLVAAVAAACREQRRPADPAHLAAVEKARAARLSALTAESGWLTLTGIHWLKAGTTSVGGAAGCDVVLRGDGVPALVGTLELGPDDGVVLRPEPGAGVTLRGAPMTAATALRTDRSGAPDVVEVAGLRLTVIDRGGARALRVRDPRSRLRTDFQGLSYFPVDDRYRVEATLERFAAPREAAVPSAQGPAPRRLGPGVRRFSVDGRPCTLEPFAAGADAEELFLVFGDATGGAETYGAGRFLDAPAPPPASSTVVLDFNLAYNPPCAFTPYATCPLPPPQNVLPVPIRAGEKAPQGH